MSAIKIDDKIIAALIRAMQKAIISIEDHEMFVPDPLVPADFVRENLLPEMIKAGLTIALPDQTKPGITSVDVALVFDDWRKKGKSIYNTERGVELSNGDFHSGTTFHGTIDVDDQLVADELLAAIKQGYQPVFRVTMRQDQ